MYPIGLDMINLYAKFEFFRFTHFEDGKGDQEFTWLFATVMDHSRPLEIVPFDR